MCRGEPSPEHQVGKVKEFWFGLALNRYSLFLRYVFFMKGSINKIIKFLIVGDFFFNASLGLISPIFALFVVLKITNNDAATAAKVVGLATFFLWFIKSLIQIPIGKFLDKNYGEKDDFWFMFIGSFIIGISPFGYLFSTEIWHIYSISILQSVGLAMLVPPWYAVFTRHIDKNKEASEWGIDSTALGIGIGVAGAIGGFLVAQYGFNIIFILSGALGMIATTSLLFIKKEIYSGENIPHKIPPARLF